ncbi:MAG TPA: DUF4214 domain-containing protein [Vicinamibacteria bacterium]|nr:DUF4214 domain-containing protein [Vicinamibacteria bacterium]
MPSFAKVVREAYRDILAREPDPGGLASFNDAMNQGMTEALMREALIRSPEYAEKNPDVAPAARPAPRTRKSAGHRKKTSQRRQQ